MFDPPYETNRPTGTLARRVTAGDLSRIGGSR